MTLQDILDKYPNADYSQIVVFADGQCVYDYKKGAQCIELLSNDDCYSLEQVNLLELVEYSDECTFTVDQCYIKSEDTKEYFTSYDINGNQLNFKY